MHPRAWLVVLLAVVLLALLHWQLSYGVASAAVMVLVSVVAMVVVLGAWWWRRDLHRRPSWLLIGLAAVAAVIGNLLWYTEHLAGAQGYLVIPNLFYLVTYTFLVLGLWWYGRSVESNQGAVMDALMVVVAAAVLFWALMVAPHWRPEAGLAVLILPSAYPVADLLLLLFTLKIYFLAPTRSTALSMVLIAVILLLVADLIHAHGVTTNWYEPGTAVDLLWFAVYGLLAAAAWHPSASRPLDQGSGVAEHPFLRLLVIGLISIAVPATVLITAGSDHELVRVGAAASIVLFVLMLVRLSLLLRANQRQADVLVHMSRVDPLTGAANRRWLDERLALEMERSRRTGAPLQVAFLDLDHFKRYNDENGHGAGDELLRGAVAGWRQVLRGTDLLARIGGEEFVLLAPDAGPEAVWPLLERLRAAIPEGQTASMGVTGLRAGDTPESLLERADAAVYRAKEAGRDRVVIA